MKASVRSLKCSCACLIMTSRTFIGSKYDSEARGESVDRCKAGGQQRTWIGKSLQQFDCSVNLCCMLDDSSLFHVAFEVPSLCRQCARRPEASHDVGQFHRTISSTSCQHLFLFVHMPFLVGDRIVFFSSSKKLALYSFVVGADSSWGCALCRRPHL